MSELLLKMSAKLVDRIAWMPQLRSAHGACSRELPVPKLSPARRILRPGMPGWSRMNGGSFLAAVLLEPPVAEQRVREALLVGHLEVAGRDDLVRVDVLRAPTGRPCCVKARKPSAIVSTPRRR